MNERPVTVLIAALGGEGGGVLAEWLVSAATRAGYVAQATSIPGVAQRTGATTYYVEVFPVPIAELGARRPVLSLAPVPGEVDLLLASEPLEAARHVLAGMTTRQRTLIITSTTRTLTTAEKMSLGDGRFDPERLAIAARAHARRLVRFDMQALAQRAGTAPSAVLLGAAAASGVLPMTRGDFEATIREAGRGVEPSLAGFDLAWEAVFTGLSEAPALSAARVKDLQPPPLERPMDRASPATDYATLGEARVREYLDGAYARLYRQRLEQVAEAERAASSDGSVAREVARYLAVWMSYEDVIRVADLKSRASRFERVRHETGAQSGEIVRIQDHFRPGVAEVADLLPPALARRLHCWSQRRQAAGKGALSWPLKLEASSLHGFLGLRLLAACKGLRRRSARFAEEQALIERWLGAVRGVVPADRRWALELARCGRLVKGYGATNARGKANLVHILDHLANPAEAAGYDMAARVRAVCSAALEDDAGRRVDEAMGGFGIAPRPPQARPIRFLPRRVARQGGAA